MRHMKHKSCAMIFLGLILITNEYYLRINWWYLFGGLLVLTGIKHMFLCKGHGKECCKGDDEECYKAPEKKSKKKK
jgi:hypothetical protein